MPNAEEAHDRRATDLPDNAHVTVVEVDDPYGELGKQERSKVIISLRTDPLAWMWSHGRIDDACYRAGRKWQQLYSRSNIGSIKSIDLTRPAVSGGKLPEAITDGHIKAFRELRDADDALGTEEQRRLIFDVLAMEKFPTQVARERGEYSSWAPKKWTRKLYKALNKLAVHFGYASC